MTQSNNRREAALRNEIDQRGGEFAPGAQHILRTLVKEGFRPRSNFSDKDSWKGFILDGKVLEA